MQDFSLPNHTQNSFKPNTDLYLCFPNDFVMRNQSEWSAEKENKLPEVVRKTILQIVITSYIIIFWNLNREYDSVFTTKTKLSNLKLSAARPSQEILFKKVNSVTNVRLSKEFD